ncbi:hypothetical protein M434DRAFT_358847 [Hypoxylon sp. CO27-5]|nr:hypothetical protein M434DRAFT_358847 [Hypoxylon sp. CO27-5]
MSERNEGGNFLLLIGRQNCRSIPSPSAGKVIVRFLAASKGTTAFAANPCNPQQWILGVFSLVPHAAITCGSVASTRVLRMRRYGVGCQPTSIPTRSCRGTGKNSYYLGIRFILDREDMV